METNLIYQDENRSSGMDDPNSGGFTAFILPGFQYVTKRWIAEAGVQVPLVQELSGAALEKAYMLRGGFRVNF